MSVRNSLRLTHPNTTYVHTQVKGVLTRCVLFYLYSLPSLSISYEVAQHNGAEVPPQEIDESGFGADH